MFNWIFFVLISTHEQIVNKETRTHTFFIIYALANVCKDAKFVFLLVVVVVVEVEQTFSSLFVDNKNFSLRDISHFVTLFSLFSSHERVAAKKSFFKTAKISFMINRHLEVIFLSEEKKNRERERVQNVILVFWYQNKRPRFRLRLRLMLLLQCFDRCRF